jgi:Tol biopolymer transport system component
MCPIEDGKWSVSIIDLKNNKPFDITKNLKSYSIPGPSDNDDDNDLGYSISQTKRECYSPSWSSDSKSILTQDMDTIFQINLKGEIINKFKIKGFGGSSVERCILSTDNQNIVYESNVDDSIPEGFHSNFIAVFIYNIKTKQSKRITPIGYSCSDIFLSGDKIYFDCLSTNPKSYDIFSIDLDGNNFKRELKNCYNFSKRNK